MGDSKRFRLMASLVEERFPNLRHSRVADIAGGKGQLQTALRRVGWTNIVSFDKRHGYGKPHRPQYQYHFFHWHKTPGDFRLLVAMHPDEATDHTILAARRLGAPFVICPCCIKPDAASFLGEYRKRDWIRHLKELASVARIEEVYLPMAGDNVVLIGRF